MMPEEYREYFAQFDPDPYKRGWLWAWEVVGWPRMLELMKQHEQA